MHDFVQLLLEMLRQGGKLALGAGILCVVGVGLAYLLYQRKRQPGAVFPWRKALAAVALAGYLALLLYVTLLRQVGGGPGQVNLHLFLAWREAWNGFTLKLWLNVLLNIALFLPLGFLLPLLAKPFQRWYLTLPTGFGLSLAIETTQYLLGRGMFDVDDLFTNTLGTALGFSFAMLLLRLFPGRGKERRGWAPHLICPLAFGLALLGIFGGYQMKEYGNLPEAPAYTADLRGMDWQLAWEPEEGTETAYTYRSSPFTKESCDAFGAEFAHNAGVTFPDAYYYDDLTVFANHSTGDFLNVTYHDRSYEYRSSARGNAPGAEGTEALLREKLAALGLFVPEGADFAYEGEGWHSFTARFLPDGEQVVNGGLRCRYQENGTFGEIDSTLAVLTPYKEEPILTQAEALERLRRGKFEDAGLFEQPWIQGARILACNLDYRADTKGFYQPVYVFTVLPLGQAPGGYRLEAGEFVLPALK